MIGYSVSGGTGSSRLRIWLSQGISCTPNSDEALFRPNCLCIRTWLSRGRTDFARRTRQRPTGPHPPSRSAGHCSADARQAKPGRHREPSRSRPRRGLAAGWRQRRKCSGFLAIIGTSSKIEVNTIPHCLPALFLESTEFPSIFIAQVPPILVRQATSTASFLGFEMRTAGGRLGARRSGVVAP